MADEDVSTWNLEDCKAKQKSIRYRITGCHTRITNIVRRHLSRRDAEKQLTDARNLLGELETINDRILELLEEDLGDAQNTQHLTYDTTVDNASALVETYLVKRRNDAAFNGVGTTLHPSWWRQKSRRLDAKSYRTPNNG